METKLKAVSFDAGGTLIHLAEPVGLTYSLIAQKHRIDAQAEALELAFREVWKQTEPPFQAGVCEQETEEGWWAQLVRVVFERANANGLQEGNFAAFFAELYHYYGQPKAWVLDPEAIELIDQLEKTGIRLAIISNFDQRLLSIFEGHSILDRFDPIVLSSEVRCSKPAEAIFRVALEKLQLPASEILHVGDDPVCDIAAAESLGMSVFQVGSKAGKLSDILENFCLQSD